MKKNGTLGYEECSKKLEQLWVDYNKLLPTYEKLISIKRELGINLCRLPVRITRKQDFPDIEFLKLKSLEEAIEYIYNLNLVKMRKLIGLIEKDKEHGSYYAEMTIWIRSAIYDIRHYGIPKKYSYHRDEAREKNKRALMLLATIQE